MEREELMEVLQGFKQDMLDEVKSIVPRQEVKQ